MAKLKRVTKLKRPAPAGSDVPTPRFTVERSDPDLVVRTTIARQLDLRPDDVTGDVHLHSDLGMDDAQLPELLNAMGEALDVRFPDDFFDGVQTVAQLTAAVRVSLSPL